MKTNFFIRNEKGGMAALLSVIVLSMIMVMSLTATYTYLQNQSLYQAFVKANYQMGFTMEDLGQATLQAYQQFQAGGGVCPAGTAPRWLDCTQVCMPTTASYNNGTNVPPWGKFGGAGDPKYAICVTSTMNYNMGNSNMFCTYNMDANFGAGATAPNYCPNLPTADNFKPAGQQADVAASYRGSKLDRWYARLDKFFNTTVRAVPEANREIAAIMGAPQIQPPTMWGWLLPEKSYAHTYQTSTPSNPQDTSVNIGTIQCQTSGTIANSNSCKKCGKTERTNGSCIDLAVCPPWQPRSTSAGTTAAWSEQTCQQMVQNYLSNPKATQDPRYHRSISLQ